MKMEMFMDLWRWRGGMIGNGDIRKISFSAFDDAIFLFMVIVLTIKGKFEREEVIASQVLQFLSSV